MIAPLEAASITGISLLASFHCLGMCGGIAAAVGSMDTQLSQTKTQLLYQGSRLLTYLILGGFAGAIGAFIATYQYLHPISVFLSFLGGLLFIALAGHYLGAWQLLHRGNVWAPRRVTTSYNYVFQKLTRIPDAGAVVGIGLLNGLLPCGLVWAWLVQASAQDSAANGAWVMFFFGLGTLPMMVFATYLPGLISIRWRQWGLRFAGVGFLLFGCWMLYRTSLEFPLPSTRIFDLETPPRCLPFDANHLIILVSKAG
jgi:sulfite exporter TauE/SafE